jgi:glutamine cyclotransferase
MSEKKTQTIVIDDVEHDTANFTEEQILLTNHCLDLDRKIGSSQFQIQQLQVGKDAFVKMLKDSLAKPKE